MMLMNVMTVECLPRRMQVSFPRPTVEKLGLAPEDVSLLFSHCSVTPNETHYVLSTPFHYCGTKQEIVNDKVIYRNAVSISKTVFLCLRLQFCVLLKLRYVVICRTSGTLSFQSP